jgi:hypothetical protein
MRRESGRGIRGPDGLAEKGDGRGGRGNFFEDGLEILGFHCVGAANPVVELCVPRLHGCYVR